MPPRRWPAANRDRVERRGLEIIGRRDGGTAQRPPGSRFLLRVVRLERLIGTDAGLPSERKINEIRACLRRQTIR